MKRLAYGVLLAIALLQGCAIGTITNPPEVELCEAEDGTFVDCRTYWRE